MGALRAQLLVEPAAAPDRSARSAGRKTRAGRRHVRSALRVRGRALLADPRRVHVAQPVSDARVPRGPATRSRVVPGADGRPPLGTVAPRKESPGGSASMIANRFRVPVASLLACVVASTCAAATDTPSIAIRAAHMWDGRADARSGPVLVVV